MITITTPALAAAERLRNKCQVTTYLRDAPQPDRDHEPRAWRTARIRNQVRDFIAQGLEQAQIAAKLDITEAGVRYHLKAIALEDR